MAPNPILSQLRAAKLQGMADVQSLVEQAGSLSGRDVLDLTELVKKRPRDSGQHHLRCMLFARLVEASGDRKLFVPLLEFLESSDPTVRGPIAQVLPKVNDPAGHPQLCRLLDHDNASVRTTAAQVLAEVGGRTALAELEQLMAKPGFQGRGAAIDAVVRIAGHHAIPALVGSLGVCSKGEKLKIVRYLGEERFMAGNRVAALDALAQLLGDDDESVATSIIQAFSGLATFDEWVDHVGPLLDSPRLPLVLAAVRGLRRFEGAAVITLLRGKLKTSPKVVRIVVIETLEAMATDAVLPAVVDALEDRLLEVRTRAADALANLGTSGKVEISRTLLWLLRSHDAEVRRMAVDVVRKTRVSTEELWPRLFELLADEDWWVRERVTDALIELAGERLIPYFVAFLQDPRAPVRLSAVEVLRRLKSPKALGALVRAAGEDGDWWVRERAMAALAEIGDARAAPYLVRIALKEAGLRIAALAAIQELGTPEAAPQVARLLRSRDAEVRLAALRCIEKLGERGVAAEVAALTADPDTAVRKLAAHLADLWELRASLQEGEVPLSRLDALLVHVASERFDDLLLSPGSPPMAKRMGRVEPLEDQPLGPPGIEAMLVPLLTAQHISELQGRRDVDFSYEVAAEGVRFRVNVFHQLQGLSAVFRVVRGELPSLDELGLPEVVRRLDKLKNGLVLVGGPTGSGKSTTLAALVDAINRTSGRHVITLEDPIEVVHPRKKSLINQREIGTHTSSYDQALRATLRQDPDVLLVGELRDLPTIAFAVTAAETGHLVLGTVHTVSADTTLDRLINAFPAAQQEQVRNMLAGSLRAVVCQYLLPRLDGEGRCLACEVMLNNDAVAHMIRQGKCYQLPSVITTSKDAGMQTMDGELLRLYKEGTVGAEVVYMKARNKKDFEALVAKEPGGAVVAELPE
ncbi:MAG: PilT/PilU family type 4a pilus ATPase [Pseudomonadota bacterium]